MTNERSESITVRVTAEQKRKLQDIADREELSLSTVLRQILRRRLEREDDTR
jgi:predicted transcriptional regulator